jgi:hypothetical protein
MKQTMTTQRGRAAMASAFLMTALLFLASAAGVAQTGQGAEAFKARLSPVPINISMMATIAGQGSLTATLNGKELSIQGTFEGLRSPATTAQIRRGPKGIPGTVVPNLDLMVTKATKGSVNGTLQLTPEQIADLRNVILYVQIQSEKAPDGNLWGWLLK